MQRFFLLVWVLLGDWKNRHLALLTIFSGFQTTGTTVPGGHQAGEGVAVSGWAALRAGRRPSAAAGTAPLPAPVLMG